MYAKQYPLTIAPGGDGKQTGFTKLTAEDQAIYDAINESNDITAYAITHGGSLLGALNEAQGADIASATTTDIGAATGNYLNVTGTTTITGLGTVQAGTRRIVTFTGILTLTYNATSLILPTLANIATAVGDTAQFVSLGSGNWRCTAYQRATGWTLDFIYNAVLTGLSTATATAALATDTILAAIGKLQAQITAIFNLHWTEKFILNNPANAYVSPGIPLTRNGTMTTMDFYCTGTPASSTNIVVKQGATTVGTVAISAAGKTTLTFGTAVTGTLDDLFSYTVGGAGLAACTVVANMKWGNR